MNSKIKNIALATLTAATLAGNAKAEDTITGRARAEYTEAQNPSLDLFKTTFGATLNPVNGEFFRLYNYQGDNIHYSTAGIKINGLDIGELKNTAVIFGSDGTKDSSGIRTVSSYGNATLELNAEQNETAAGKSTRLGAGLDYKIGKFVVSAAFDQIGKPNDQVNIPLISTYVDIDQNNQTGLGFRQQIGQHDTVNSVGAYYMHWGKDATWGTRASVMQSWNEKSDAKQTKWGVIAVSGTPTLIHDAGFLPISRLPTYWFDAGVAENPVDTIERVYVGKRTKGGIAFSSDGTISDKAGALSGTVKDALVYTIPVGKAIFAPGVYQKYDFNAKEDTHTAGLTALLRAPLGKNASFELEGSVGKGIAGSSSNREMESYGSAQFTYRF